MAIRVAQLTMVATPQRIQRPKTLYAKAEVQELQDAIEQLKLIRAEIQVIKDHEKGEESSESKNRSVRLVVVYADPFSPKVFWGQWLIARVWPVEGVCWHARLTGYAPDEKQLLLVPRTAVDRDLARRAAKGTPPPLHRLVFSLLLEKSEYSRPLFIPAHPSP